MADTLDDLLKKGAAVVREMPEEEILAMRRRIEDLTVAIIKLCNGHIVGCGGPHPGATSGGEVFVALSWATAASLLQEEAETRDPKLAAFGMNVRQRIAEAMAAIAVPGPDMVQ